MRGVDETGRVLGGKYELRRVLGEGGWGAVYEAVQVDLGRRVAVKVLHTHLALSTEAMARFEREAKAAAALGHPNIVQVTDFQANSNEPPFLVMEYLSGRTLTSALGDGGRLPGQRVAFIAQQILGALAAAHAAGIVHRDVKPDNVFLLEVSGVEDIVKVLDFGVAKLKGEGAQLTGGGALLGSPAYMAPEQIRGGEVDARVDIWSVGVCMYRALTGKMPFEATSLHALMRTITDVTPPSVSSTRADVDPGLVAIVERAMHKDAAGRYASAEEMSRALEPYARPTTARSPSHAGGTTAMPARPMVGAPGSAVPSHLSHTSPPALAGLPAPLVVPTPIDVTMGAAGASGVSAPPGAGPTPAPVGYSAPTPAARGSSGALIGLLVGVIAFLTLAVVGVAGAFYLVQRDRPVETASNAPSASVAAAQAAASAASAGAAAPTSTTPSAPADGPPDPPDPAPAPTTTGTAKRAPAPAVTPSPPGTPNKPATPGRERMGAPTARYTGGTWGPAYTVEQGREAITRIAPLVNRCYASSELEPPNHEFTGYQVHATASGVVTTVGTVGTAARCARLDTCMFGTLRAMHMPPTKTGGDFRIFFSARLPR